MRWKNCPRPLERNRAALSLLDPKWSISSSILLDTPPTSPCRSRFLEPSFGGGTSCSRLSAGCSLHGGRRQAPAAPWANSIRAVELHRETFQSTFCAVTGLLTQEGLALALALALAEALAGRWLTQGDFLLAPLDGEFDFVVGNPPYVRPPQTGGHPRNAPLERLDSLGQNSRLGKTPAALPA